MMIIELTSKFGRKTKYKWDYSILFNFRTQFEEGLIPLMILLKTTTFQSFSQPAYPLLAMGFDYKKEQEFLVFFASHT